MIDFYNSEVKRFSHLQNQIEVDSFVKYDATRISWNRGFLNDLKRLVTYKFEDKNLYVSMYRPYTKSHLYFSKYLNDMVYQMNRVFPFSNADNLIIYLSGVGGAGKGCSALISNTLPDLNMQHSGGQGFPLYLYESNDTKIENDLFGKSNSATKLNRRDAITTQGLAHFQKAYPTEKIIKEDIFYYVYGLLHSEDYKSRYADNLTKELPRIPIVKKAEDFWIFSKAGRALADLHINYETVAPYPVEYEEGKLAIEMFNNEDFHVTQMKFAKGKDGEKYDKTKVIYNNKITMTKIPLKAYEYIVNGKPALEWVMERQAVTTHKESGIVNDANDWAVETMGNPRYPLELFQHVITVSLETMKIVNNLPKLEI